MLASSCPQEQAGLPASLRRAPSPFVSLRMCASRCCPWKPGVTSCSSPSSLCSPPLRSGVWKGSRVVAAGLGVYTAATGKRGQCGQRFLGT